MQRLENMETYSNILYVKEKKAELSFLAHRATSIDKYRPGNVLSIIFPIFLETCCIIGNFYSIKSEHEKAVIYFKRALKLNSKFVRYISNKFEIILL